MGKEFGKRLHWLRLDADKSVGEVASALGLTTAAVSNYENGRNYPTVTTLSALADYYNVSVDYLLGRTDLRRLPDMDNFDELSQMLLDLGLYLEDFKMRSNYRESDRILREVE